MDEFQKQNFAARKKLGITGPYPYPIWFYLGRHRVKALNYRDAFVQIFNTPISEQIPWFQEAA